MIEFSCCLPSARFSLPNISTCNLRCVCSPNCTWLLVIRDSHFFYSLLLHLLDSKNILSLEREYDKKTNNNKKYIWNITVNGKKIILHWDKKYSFYNIMKILKRKRAAFYPNISYAFLKKWRKKINKRRIFGIEDVVEMIK